MSTKNFIKMTVLMIVLVGVCADFAWADKQQLQEKLSKDISIKLNDVTITEALEKIGRKAELKIVLSDEAIWKLPQGEATRLSVELDGPLAESLTEMLNTFFMRYAVGEEEITIYPRPELKHILGRPSTKQLELLKKIYSFKVTVQGGVSPDTVVGIIKAGLGEVSIPYYVQESMYNILNTMVTDKGSLPIALAFLLEQAGENQNVPRWYLSGMDFPNQIPQIRLVNEKDFREAKLNQIVDISFKDESAFVILQRLASWADMELFIYKHDPSWLEREISVDMQNVKLKQALQNVASTVDGEISVNAERNSIYVQGPLHEPRPAVRKATKSSDYVGKISIPMDSGKYYIEFMLRESDLTEELKKLRADKMKEILDQLGGSGTD